MAKPTTITIPAFKIEPGERIEFRNPSVKEWQEHQDRAGHSVADYLQVQMTIEEVSRLSVDHALSPEFVEDHPASFSVLIDWLREKCHDHPDLQAGGAAG